VQRNPTDSASSSGWADRELRSNARTDSMKSRAPLGEQGEPREPIAQRLASPAVDMTETKPVVTNPSGACDGYAAGARVVEVSKSVKKKLLGSQHQFNIQDQRSLSVAQLHCSFFASINWRMSSGSG
jgi:hypothetical protein